MESLAPQARHHFKTVFEKEVEEFLNSNTSLLFEDGKCDTIEKQGAVARILATNVEIKGWSKGNAGFGKLL